MILGVWTATASAHAAEITVRPDLAPRLLALKTIYSGAATVVRPEIYEESIDDWPQGIIFLSGPIETGDLDRLRAITGDLDTQKLPLFHVVFDSPGGSLTEAAAIGRFLSEWRNFSELQPLGGVFVLKGHECLSACALAFSMSVGSGDAGSLVRFVEHGARLGLHMPFLPSNLGAQKAQLSQAFDLSFDVMEQFVQLVADGNAPVSLLQNVLHYRGEDQFLDLSGGMMTRHFGFNPVASESLSHLVSIEGLEEDMPGICQYYSFSRQGGMPTLYEYLNWALRIDCSGIIEDYYDDTYGISRIAQLVEENYTFRVTGGLLADYLGCHGGELTKDYYAWDIYNRFLDEERPAWLDRDGWEYLGGQPFLNEKTALNWQREVLTRVKMRDAPGFDGQTLGTLEQGTRVEVVDCAVLSDEQGVWFEVEVDGTNAWVSARFVSRNGLRDENGNSLVIRPTGTQ